MTTTTVDNAPSNPTTFRRVLSGSMVGAVLEWYDFAVYGALAATVFAEQFFPNSSPHTGILLAFGTQAIGFVARPLGGVVFGHLGDVKGRKFTLVITYVILGLATAMIGFLPNYAAWGVLAPVGLVVLRFIQGFALGGEFGAAVVLVSEHSRPRNRGRWCSLPQTGGPAGTLLATGVLSLLTNLLPHDAFNSWGWRVAFLVALPLLAIGAWLRRSVEDSPTFVKAVEHRSTAERSPVYRALAQPIPILQGLGIRIGENVAFYIYTVFVLAYATNTLGFDRGDVFLIVTVAAAFQLVAMILGGYFSDIVGRRPVMLTATLILAAWAPVFFWLAQQGSLALLSLGVCFGAFVHGLLAGPEAAWISELFPTTHRTAGTNLAVQGSSILGGGPAPLIATALIGTSGNTTWVVVYLVVAALVSAIAIVSGPETKGIDLKSIT